MIGILIIRDYLRPNSDGTFTPYLIPKVGKTKTRGFSTEIRVSAKDLGKNKEIKNAEIQVQIEEIKRKLRLLFAVLSQRRKHVTAKMLQDEFLTEEMHEFLSVSQRFIEE